MVAIWTLCAFIGWTPSWDYDLMVPVPVHYFYEDALPAVLAWNSEMEVCRVDYDVAHTYYVEGFNADYVSTPSDPLTVIWPVPEPELWMMLLAGWVLLHCLFWRRRRG